MRSLAFGRALLVVAFGVSLAACEGPAGPPGANGGNGISCTVKDNGDGSATITCADGTKVTVANGVAGAPGTSCTVKDNHDGTKTITCGDGTSVTVSDGQGAGGGPAFEITNFHGADYLSRSGEYANGAKTKVDPVIDSATADAAGLVTVNFHVADADGKPVADVPSITATVAKLVPAAAGEASNKWVAYIYRTEKVTGTSFPNPDGTIRYQAYREGNGTLTNKHDGSYTYVFKTNLTAAMMGDTPISYERGLTHRVTVMTGGHAGPTGDAWLDFVPDGSGSTATRDIIRTETCKQCHGEEFHAHGGDRLHVEVCATCHVPGNEDAQSGNSLDLKTMIHKIHAGGELPTAAGPDGILWDDPTTPANEEADNQPFTIYGFNNTAATWWKAEFPSVLSNCQKCHQGSGADVDNWKTRPSIKACTSCHDNVDITSGTNHSGGPQANDATCTTCHPSSGKESAGDHAIPKPIAAVHDWTIRDARNIPEFNVTRLDITGASGGGGAYFRPGDVPVVHVKLADIDSNETITVPYQEDDAAEGCTSNGERPPACNEPRDGKFRSVNLFVSGPRADRAPVLTTQARAQNSSSGAGPWDIAATSFNNTGSTPAVSGKVGLTLKVDNGSDIHVLDSSGGDVTALSLISVAMPDLAHMPSYWPDATMTTTANLRDWLNKNAAFKFRAVAFVDGAGKLWIRSRNKGKVFSVQLLSGELTKSDGSLPFTVTGNASDIKTPAGSTISNKLMHRLAPAADDPKLSWDTDANEALYTLDPVDDLVPGTYVLKLEITDRGTTSNDSYKTPTVAKATFQVMTATEEKPPAANCQTCHTGADGRGLVIDPLRHNKHLDFFALDTCGSCHDYLPQNLTASNGFWTGPVPISRRVHAVHRGAHLMFPNYTVGHADNPPGRNWAIEFPRDIRDCEACHQDGTTSGSWKTKPARLPCMGCHDDDAALGHYSSMVYDPTPADPWSGDEREACATCHAVEP